MKTFYLVAFCFIPLLSTLSSCASIEGVFNAGMESWIFILIGIAVAGAFLRSGKINR